MAAALIHFSCDGCGHALRVAPEAAGKAGTCPKCKARLIVPARDVRGHADVAIELDEGRQPTNLRDATTSAGRPIGGFGMTGVLIFAILALASMSKSIPATFVFLALTIMMFRYPRRWLLDRAKIDPPFLRFAAATTAIVFMSVVGLIFLGTGVNNAAEKARISEQARADEFAKVRVGIVAEIRSLIDKQAFDQAIALGEAQRAYHDPDIAKLVAEAEAERLKIENAKKLTVLKEQWAHAENMMDEEKIALLDQILALEPENQKLVAERNTLVSRKLEAEAEVKKRELGLYWTYRNNADEMSGKNISYAVVSAVNPITLAFPYGGAQRARLILRQHPRYGFDVLLQLDRAQFLCGLDACDLTVRFDDGPPKAWSASPPSDHDTTTLFLQNETNFLAAIRKAKVVKIEPQFFQDGTRVLEFDVSRLEWPR